jgi:hypothetical protein
MTLILTIHAPLTESNPSPVFNLRRNKSEIEMRRLQTPQRCPASMFEKLIDWMEGLARKYAT